MNVNQAILQQPFSLNRQVIAHMTTASWQNIPHVSYQYEADVTDFLNCFRGKKPVNEDTVHITLNTLFLKCIIEGLKAAPKLNAYISYDHHRAYGKVQQLEKINLSIPWLLPDGNLVTPTLYDCGEMTLSELSQAIDHLGKRIQSTDLQTLLFEAARVDTIKELAAFRFAILGRVFSNLGNILRMNKRSIAQRTTVTDCERLLPADLRAGSVTISNIGSLYPGQKGAFGLLEIIPPQVFAIGLDAVQERPGIRVNEAGQKEIAIRQILPMCLVFDHRALDFNDLVPFLKKLDDNFSKPEQIEKW